jgi:dGTPase
MFEGNDSSVASEIVGICNDPNLNGVTKIVNIRIKLISYFVHLAYENFEKNLDLIEEGKYNMELIRDDQFKIYKLLKDCCTEKIFSSREINYLEVTGYSVFKGLLDFYIQFLFHPSWKYRNRAKSLISRSIIDAAIEENLIEIADKRISLFKTEDERAKGRTDLEEYKKLFFRQIDSISTVEETSRLKQLRLSLIKLVEPQFEDLSNYYKFRVILDFISGMTDQFALNHYQKLSGQKII